MLEFFFLRFFYRKLASNAEAKGRSRGWGALGVALWIAGEFLGFIIGTIAEFETGGCYGLAILMAVLGAGIAYLAVNALGSEAKRYEVTGAPVATNYDPSNPYNPPRVYFIT